ncbi:unnamed protein product [Porites evermanni]|uniref:QRICH1-like domain-containing protein n=1 Tax=Porites evermanni TaxID=104178 RepID=A0ABN8LHS3_9CNID|nr:unnamed protein product [Porites evermanni]
MDALTLNYWLSKFVQEVAKCSKDPYPPKTLYQIVCSIRRFLVEKNPAFEFNLFSDSSDKRCVNWRYWRGEPFAIFRRILDAEMKDGTRVGVGFSETKRKRASQFVI